jgi:small subunit ribosomal protein S21
MALSLNGRKVLVTDGNVEKAMRKFKKKIQNCGLLLELRERETYTKPTTRRKIKKGQAKSRWKKHLRGQQLPPKMY